MSVGKNLALALGVAALGVTTALAGSGPAYAGSRGQQIEYIDNTGQVLSVYMSGTNQDGGHYEGCFKTPSFKNPFTGYWWQGSIDIKAYQNSYCSGSYYVANYPSIPAYSPHDYWAIDNNDNRQADVNQQIEFFDNLGDTASIAITGTNQSGQWIDGACFNTPSWDNPISNWWWNGSRSNVSIAEYSGQNCTGTYLRGRSEFTGESGAWFGFKGE